MTQLETKLSNWHKSIRYVTIVGLEYRIAFPCTLQRYYLFFYYTLIFLDFFTNINKNNIITICFSAIFYQKKTRVICSILDFLSNALHVILYFIVENRGIIKRLLFLYCYPIKQNFKCSMKTFIEWLFFLPIFLCFRDFSTLLLTG